MKNSDIKTQIETIIKNNPNNYACVLSHKKELLKQLNEAINPIFLKYALKTKLFYFLNNKKDFIKCEQCGDLIKEDVINYNKPKNICKKCKKENGYKKAKEHREQTCLKKYGAKHVWSKNSQVRFKQYDTCLEKYGNKNYNNPDKAKRTKEIIYGDPNFHNIEKAKRTSLEKYGTEHPQNSKEIKEKFKNTCLERFGVQAPMQLESIREKSKQTCLQKYGVEYSFQSENNKQKSIQTLRKKYNDDTIINSGQIPEVFSKQRRKYHYNGILFHSRPEIIFYIYCKDHNINCEYNTTFFIEYTYNNKKHRYYPDFIVNGKFVEIKGDHFFNKDGTMKNPWDKNDNLIKAKYNCMIKNNIKIVKISEMTKYNMYVKKTYGNHYLEQFKNDTNGNFKSQEQNS